MKMPKLPPSKITTLRQVDVHDADSEPVIVSSAVSRYCHQRPWLLRELRLPAWLVAWAFVGAVGYWLPEWARAVLGGIVLGVIVTAFVQWLIWRRKPSTELPIEVQVEMTLHDVP